MRRLSETVSVAPQVRPEDLAELARQGVRTLINNRPDGEEPGQPTSAEMEAAARAASVNYVAIPFAGKPGESEIAAMGEALAAAEGPVLAFCRSGTRSAAAWATVQTRQGRSADEVLEAGDKAGYDLRAWLV